MPSSSPRKPFADDVSAQTPLPSCLSLLRYADTYNDLPPYSELASRAGRGAPPASVATMPPDPFKPFIPPSFARSSTDHMLVDRERFATSEHIAPSHGTDTQDPAQILPTMYHGRGGDHEALMYPSPESPSDPAIKTRAPQTFERSEAGSSSQDSVYGGYSTQNERGLRADAGVTQQVSKQSRRVANGSRKRAGQGKKQGQMQTWELTDCDKCCLTSMAFYEALNDFREALYKLPADIRTDEVSKTAYVIKDRAASQALLSFINTHKDTIRDWRRFVTGAGASEDRTPSPFVQCRHEYAGEAWEESCKRAKARAEREGGLAVKRAAAKDSSAPLRTTWRTKHPRDSLMTAVIQHRDHLRWLRIGLVEKNEGLKSSGGQRRLQRFIAREEGFVAGLKRYLISEHQSELARASAWFENQDVWKGSIVMTEAEASDQDGAPGAVHDYHISDTSV